MCIRGVRCWLTHSQFKLMWLTHYLQVVYTTFKFTFSFSVVWKIGKFHFFSSPKIPMIELLESFIPCLVKLWHGRRHIIARLDSEERAFKAGPTIFLERILYYQREAVASNIRRRNHVTRRISFNQKCCTYTQPRQLKEDQCLRPFCVCLFRRLIALSVR